MAQVDLARLVVRMEAQSAKYLKDLEKQRKETQKWRKQTVGHVSAVGSTFRKLAATAGVALLTRKIVDNTRRQEQALAQLQAGYKSTGGVVGRTVDQMVKEAERLQKITIFGDEQIIEAQSQLITFTNVAEEQFDRATMAALDLSTRMGTDLKSSVIQLGKVLNDPAAQLSALSRSGIQFNDTQRDMIRNLVASGDLVKAQNIVLAELERQFGGSAIAARDTFGGALTSLGNAFGDLLEGKGGDGGGMDGAIESIESLTKLLQDPKTIEAFGTLTSFLANMVGLLAKAVIGWDKIGGWVKGLTGPGSMISAGAFGDALTPKGGDKSTGGIGPILINQGNDGEPLGPPDPNTGGEVDTGADIEVQQEYWAERARLAKEGAELEKQIEGEILAMKFAVASQALDLIANTAKEGTALQKVAFLASRAMAVAQAIINAEVAATAALAVPPPPVGAALATTMRGLGYASAAIIAAQTIASFDGGGFTGSGSRSGGMDGKGGFMAMMHPNETVIDHTKGQSAGTVVNNYDFRGSELSEARVRRMIEEQALRTEYNIKKDLARG